MYLNNGVNEFFLDEGFLSQYDHRPVKWGYGALSLMVYQRTYARENEQWKDTCQRVVEGTYTVQKTHCRQLGLPWKEHKAQKSAQDMYERMFSFKWLPAGRGIRHMGVPFIYEKGGAALNSCAFVSTKDIDQDLSSPFSFCFDMTMYGVGVGFDTRGSGKVKLQKPEVSSTSHVIPDSREGWTEAVKIVLDAYAGKCPLPIRFDYSKIRAKGSPIRTFGGVAPGPKPLIECMVAIQTICASYVGKPVDSEFIVDVMNLIGKCVVSGGQRRSAEIALGFPDDNKFLDLKLDKDKLVSHRWASNNSVFVDVGTDYSAIAARTIVNGEPGYFWLNNARAYGRMEDPPNYIDERVAGANPCQEQSLEPYELCCLVETFPEKHDSIADYIKTLKKAYMYAKTVTLIPTHDKRTNQVMLRNRRIGCSQSGIMQAMEKIGYRNYFNWCDKGYEYITNVDVKYSDWLCVPRSKKKTSVKPAGTTSLLSGSTPGMHGAQSEYYIRRMQANENSSIIPICRDHGFNVVKSVYNENDYVVEFPIKTRNFSRSKRDITLQEQVDLAAQLQRWWADNQVSCTATFTKEEGKQIPRLLEAYEDRLKAISFLPLSDHGYEQAPYEEITREQYEEIKAKTKPISSGAYIEHEADDKFCDGEACEL